MRAVIQRGSHAKVLVDGETVGQIGIGVLIFLRMTHENSEKEAFYLTQKIKGLRIFEDHEGKMNLALNDVDGSTLVVSQFTLYGNVRKGRRPSFLEAARPEQAKALYEKFYERLLDEGVKVERGIFQAEMEVMLINDGPVTLVLDTTDLIA